MKPKKIEKKIHRAIYNNFYCLCLHQRIPFPQPVTMEAPIAEVLPKSKLELYREQKAAENARLAEEREMELELAKDKLKSIKQEKEHKEAMDKLAKEMASRRPLYAAVAAAGGGDEEWGAEPPAAPAAADSGGDEPKKWITLYGWCNQFTNGKPCKENCEFKHPEYERTLGQYNFPKTLKNKDGSLNNFFIPGYCAETLNGRLCDGNHAPWLKHPKGYKNSEQRGRVFREGEPNFFV